VKKLEPLPVFLFFGDEFLVKEQVEKIVSGVLSLSARRTNLIVLNGLELDAGALLGLVQTPSLFGNERVIVVEDCTFFSGKKDQAKILGRLIEAAASNDGSAVMRYTAQLMHSSGIIASDVLSGDDWLKSVSSEDLKPEIRDVTMRSAYEWAQSAKDQEPSVSDDVIDHVLECSFPEGTHLVFTALAVDKKKRSFKRLQELGVVMECAPAQEKFGPGLERSFFEGRVRGALASSGKTISRDALHRMYALTGTDIRRLESELRKLVSYVGDRTRIEISDVEDLFEDFHEAAFFELSTAVRAGELVTCLRALHQNMKIVAHPLKTLAIITNEVRRLLAARELSRALTPSVWTPGISYTKFNKALEATLRAEDTHKLKERIKRTGMKPYTLYLCLEAAQRFSNKDFLEIMEALLDADIMLKSSRIGKQGAQSLLETIVFRICSKGTTTGRSSGGVSRQRWGSMNDGT